MTRQRPWHRQLVLPHQARPPAKSAGIGLAKGAIDLAGLPENVTSFVTGGKNGSGFGSDAIQRMVKAITGEFYKPQTTAGKFAQSIGEFAPAALLSAGEMSLGTRLLRMVAAPAVASETAGKLTEGTTAEPYARDFSDGVMRLVQTHRRSAPHRSAAIGS